MKTEKKDLVPLCPHCEKHVEHLIVIKHGWFADHRVYCCPKCEKIVGVNFKLP